MPRLPDGTAVVADPRNDESVLKQAELVEDGLRLGPVGGRIAGEVVVRLQERDPASYLSYDRDRRPTLPSRSRGDFRMVDFLTFAGVDPKSGGQ